MPENKPVVVVDDEVHIDPSKMNTGEGYPYFYRGGQYVAVKEVKEIIHVYEVDTDEEKET